MLPLHIKLGLMKNLKFRSILYGETKFPKMSDAKIKEGVFVGPQIKKVAL